MSATAQFTESLRQTERLTLGQLDRFQRNSLAKLIRHAFETVPFYRDRLDVLFRRDSSIDWDRWSEVPLLTKSDIRSHGNDMLSTNLPEKHGDVTSIFSSGSTGEPVETYRTTLELIAADAVTNRYHDWHGIDRSLKTAAIRPDIVGVADYPEGRFEPEKLAASEGDVHYGPYYRLNVSTPINLQAEWLARTKAEVLHSFASNAAALAHYVARYEEYRQEINLRAVMTLGEMVTDDYRTICREAFGVDVTDCYSSRECGHIALQCPEHPQYHVQSEVNYVEVIGTSGETCNPGERGQVVCTPIYKYAMPLVRYAMNDHAIAGDGCECGRPHRVLKRILGRSRNLFRFPDGDLVQPAFKSRTFAGLLGPRQWQVAQTGPLEIEIRLVPGAGAEAMDFDGMTAYIHELLRPDLDVRFKIVDAIAAGTCGKHEDYVCELPGANDIIPQP